MILDAKKARRIRQLASSDCYEEASLLGQLAVSEMYDCCKMNLSRTHMYVQIYVIVNKMILASVSSCRLHTKTRIMLIVK